MKTMFFVFLTWWLFLCELKVKNMIEMRVGYLATGSREGLMCVVM